MHEILWQMLQLMIRQARDRHIPPHERPEFYVYGQVDLIMDTIGLPDDDQIYEILMEVITRKTGEVDALVKLQRRIEAHVSR